MNKQLVQMIEKYPQWISKYEFDPIYGYLIDPNYQPKSFDYSILLNILNNLHKLNKSGEIVSTIDSMPEIKISNKKCCYKDMVILHDACSYLIHSYIKIIKDQGVEEQQIKIHKNLAIPLAQSASFLKVKTGMATGICYNWFFKNKVEDPETIQISELGINDIGFKAYYSQPFHNQHIFMGVSIIVCYCLSKIIKNCYEINCIITLQPILEEEVRKRMKNIIKYLRKIFDINMEIHNNMDREFFFYGLRVFVAGYQNIYFEGLQQKVSSSGGAGGYDPSFQTFERAFGIKFEDQLGMIQQKLRNGMPEPNRNLIDFMETHSLIRQYCSCSSQLQNMYNQVIEAYVKYLQLHGTFIKNFLIAYMPVNSTRSSFGATGATMIQVIDRYRFVRDQQLKEEQEGEIEQENSQK